MKINKVNNQLSPSNTDNCQTRNEKQYSTVKYGENTDSPQLEQQQKRN